MIFCSVFNVSQRQAGSLSDIASEKDEFRTEASAIRTPQSPEELIEENRRLQSERDLLLRRLAQVQEDFAHSNQEVFNKFVQVHPHKDDRTRGTGLGLAIARHLVELHGGQVWVESETGVGSRFYFSLPVNQIY